MKIKCPACDFENEEGVKFCSNCNESLVTPKFSINKENIDIKRIIKKERLRMNWKQKIILAIFVPILLFSITYTFAYYVSVEEEVIQSAFTTTKKSISKLFTDAEAKVKAEKAGNPDWQPSDSESLYTYHPAVTHKYYDPYNWQRTWYVWLLFLTFCCFFEYKLFEDKEIISNVKNKKLK